MASTIIPCPSCGAKNRLGTPAAGQPASQPASQSASQSASRLPRCGRCRAALPWLVDAGDADFADQLAAPVPVLVDFWAAWCGPCRTVAPVLDELAREAAGRLKVVKLDVDANPATAARFQIQSIPALILFRDGAPIERIVGALPKAELQRRLAPYLAA